MIRIDPGQATPTFKSLFDDSTPTSIRASAVLAGGNAGKIFTDDPTHPLWGLVQEADDGTLYPGGKLDQQIFAEVVTLLRQDGYVALVFHEGDPNLELFPPCPEPAVECLEFDRPISSSDLSPYLGQLPAGYTFQRMDRSLLERTPRHKEYLSRYGSIENLLNRGIAVCILHANEPVCEAFADMDIQGSREIGIRTQKEHRRLGLATVACAHLIRLCEEAGSATYWDCVQSNTGSVRLARKLGFQNERSYKAFLFRPISKSVE